MGGRAPQCPGEQTAGLQTAHSTIAYQSWIAANGWSWFRKLNRTPPAHGSACSLTSEMCLSKALRMWSRVSAPAPPFPHPPLLPYHPERSSAIRLDRLEFLDRPSMTASVLSSCRAAGWQAGACGEARTDQLHVHIFLRSSTASVSDFGHHFQSRRAALSMGVQILRFLVAATGRAVASVAGGPTRRCGKRGSRSSSKRSCISAGPHTNTRAVAPIHPPVGDVFGALQGLSCKLHSLVAGDGGAGGCSPPAAISTPVGPPPTCARTALPPLPAASGALPAPAGRDPAAAPSPGAPVW